MHKACAARSTAPSPHTHSVAPMSLLHRCPWLELCVPAALDGLPPRCLICVVPLCDTRPCRRLNRDTAQSKLQAITNAVRVVLDASPKLAWARVQAVYSDPDIRAFVVHRAMHGVRALHRCLGHSPRLIGGYLKRILRY